MLLTFSATLLSPIGFLREWGLKAWAQVKEILPRGFPKEKIIEMNPAHIDPREMEIDPLDQFSTMGTTDLSIDLTTYRLKVHGEVDRPLSLAYDDLLKLPAVTENVLLICPGFFANHGRWTGVQMKDLLNTAQPGNGARFVDIKGRDGKSIKISFESAAGKKILLAYRINGQPLPQKHGFPLRLVVEGIYGDEWIKFVDEIVISP
jgi:DMSO/TMAO reductase YedYZ molybdopterin-dependent catalytic subunit